MGDMNHAFFGVIRGAARDAAPEAGADVLWLDAAADEHKQACDVAHLLAADVDVLVLHPVHTLRGDALFRTATAAGVPSICFRRPARSDAFSLFAGGDTEYEGQCQVEWVATALRGHGNVAILEGDPFNDNARNIAEGNRRALARHPGLRILADEVCPAWSGTVAERIAGELIDSHGAGPNGVRAFICANDGIARGAIGALEARDLAGSVLVVGGDGVQRSLGLIQAGSLHATLFHDPIALARETVRAAVGLVRGTLDVTRLTKRSPAVNPPSRPMPMLDVPFRLVTRENADEMARFWTAIGPARAGAGA
jgi:ABC-type sugar transport system substrate-binding protein